MNDAAASSIAERLEGKQNLPTIAQRRSLVLSRSVLSLQLLFPSGRGVGRYQDWQTLFAAVGSKYDVSPKGFDYQTLCHPSLRPTLQAVDHRLTSDHRQRN